MNWDTIFKIHWKKRVVLPSIDKILENSIKSPWKKNSQSKETQK